MTNQDFDLERLAEDLAPFFRGDALQGFGLPALETDYSWKIKEKVVTAVGLNHTGNGYEANAALKQAFHAKWKEPGVDRVKLAELVIKDWGKVRGNSQSRFEEYVHLAESASPDLPLKGVPSYSKLLSIAAPEVFAIYDARVAVSLTAVQTALALERTMAFSLLPGQNKVTGNTDGRGFSRLQKHSRTSLKKAGWIMIQPHRCSRAYCKLLTQIREKVAPERPLYDFEMVLFAQAEKLALHVEPSLAHQRTPKASTQKVAGQKRAYSPEFKENVVRAALRPGASDLSAAREFDTHPTNVRNWRLKHQAQE